MSQTASAMSGPNEMLLLCRYCLVSRYSIVPSLFEKDNMNSKLVQMWYSTNPAVSGYRLRSDLL